MLKCCCEADCLLHLKENPASSPDIIKLPCCTSAIPSLNSLPSPLLILVQPHWPSCCFLSIQAMPPPGGPFPCSSTHLKLSSPSSPKSSLPPHIQILGQVSLPREVFPKHLINQNSLPSTPPLAIYDFLTPYPALFLSRALVIVWKFSICFTVYLPRWIVRCWEQWLGFIIMTAYHQDLEQCPAHSSC